MRRLKMAAIGFAGFTLIATLAVIMRGPAEARTHDAATAHATPTHAAAMSVPIHRVVIQISQDDPKMMNIALNNAQNLRTYYAQRGQKVQIEFVAFGAGLAMVRSDTSPVKARVAAMSRTMHDVTFSGCSNSLAKQSRQEKKKITLLPQARLVPSGVVRIVQLEEQGWTYLRP